MQNIISMLIKATLSSKLWNNNHTVHVTQRNQKKNKTKSGNIQIDHAFYFDLAHKECNSIIKGWLRCLRSESIGRFFANNILMFDSARFLVMAQIQCSLIKKIKIGCPEHPLPPTSYVR